MKALRFLLSTCWKFEKKYILYSILYQLFYTIIPLGSIILPKYIIDELLGSRDLNKIVVYVMLLLAINFLGGICKTYFQGKMFLSKSSAFIKFQCMIAEKMAGCDYEQLEDPAFLNTKEQAGKFLYAEGRGFGMVMDDLFNIMGQIMVFAGISAILFKLSPWLLAVFVCMTLLNAYAESKVKKKYVEWDMEKAPIERKTSYLLNLVQDFRYGKEIRIYDLKNWLIGKTSEHLKNSNNFYKKQVSVMNRASYFSACLSFVRELTAYIYCVVKVLNSQIGVGAFTMYVSAITQFSQSMDSVMHSLVNIKHFGRYSSALMDYMNVPSVNSKTGKEAVPDEPYEIEFRHVWFRYPGQERYVLKDINMKLTAGRRFAVIGENGSGKTTFIKLLLRLYQPTKGEILINGKNYMTFDYKEYLKIFGVVFQDYNLLSFTIKDNVVFENIRGLGDNEIKALVERCGLHLEGRFENGVDQYINKDFEETGVIPSGGEGQKIALARALYKDAPIVILDEPTAALDPKAEYELYHLFAEAMKGKTAVFISHRLASCHFCDDILVFREGELKEQGSHEELLERNGFYAETYRLQASLY